MTRCLQILRLCVITFGIAFGVANVASLWASDPCRMNAVIVSETAFDEYTKRLNNLTKSEGNDDADRLKEISREIARVKIVEQETDREEFQIQREWKARLLLRTFKTIASRIDPHFNANEVRIKMNIIPPLATGLPSGVDPSAVKDPKLRAEYEDEIRKNREKMATSRVQAGLQRLRKHWVRDYMFVSLKLSFSDESADDQKEVEGIINEEIADKNLRKVLKEEYAELNRKYFVQANGFMVERPK